MLAFSSARLKTSSAAACGTTAPVFAQDAYGQGPTRRVVTSLAGRVEHGNSGGPAVDAQGRVRGTVFASRARVGGGFAVPDGPVRKALADANGRVSTGACAAG